MRRTEGTWIGTSRHGSRECCARRKFGSEEEGRWSRIVTREKKTWLNQKAGEVREANYGLETKAEAGGRRGFGSPRYGKNSNKLANQTREKRGES